MLSHVFLNNNCLAEERPATAFYYANHLPVELLATYPRVVVEADNVTAAELQYLKQHGVRVYAYFSIGEVGPDRPWVGDIDAAWVLGTNPGWKSKVMDMTQIGWRQYAISKKLQALKDRGFDAFFLDTMDSYLLYAKTPESQKQQQQGMVQLIRDIKQHFGEVHLLFNRGFEVLDQVASLCDGVVAESLFNAWDPGKSAYKLVNENDRTWLVNKLKAVQQAYKLPIVVLDYLPPKDRVEAEKTAEKIKALGFIPWVSTPELDYMGVGELNLIPRKVLLLYDSHEAGLRSSNVHRFLATPIEQLGYVPEYLDVRSPLPDYILKGRYAGIVTWFNSGELAGAWLQKQIAHQVKVAFMHAFPYVNHAPLKDALGIEASSDILPEPIQLETLSTAVGYEIAPFPRRLDLFTVKALAAHTPWLRVNGGQQTFSEPILTAAWGGMALSPYLFVETDDIAKPSEKIARWIIDPFKFLQAALDLPELPAPDNTTENGRRILTVHIDGDGFYNQTELAKNEYSPELIQREFIKASQLPHTVSIIEGEIASSGLKPELTARLEGIAKEIFSLANVEIASHSYSHPFDWVKAKAASTSQSEFNFTKKELRIDSEKRYTLPIPNYRYSAEREVVGSARYIDTQLAPVHKKTRVFLWTGDALPDEEAITWAENAHLANMNGGNTVSRNGQLTLTDISPSGIVVGQHFQPYAPIQNENSYTNDWLGPFYGYQEVINTFKLTDSPIRLKPISIYYHFYSGDKAASVAALHRVYSWAQTQETLPLWISEYTSRLYAFREAVYEKTAQGWKIHHAADLKSLRLPSTSRLPNLAASQGLAGYRVLPQGVYLNLTGEELVSLDFSPNTSTLPYLHNSNAQLSSWQVQGRRIDFSLKGHQPVTIALANFSEHCVLKQGSTQLQGLQQNGLYLFNLTTSDSGILNLICE